MSDEAPLRSSAAIEALLATLRDDPSPPVSARTIERAQEVHVADSLSGLQFEQLGAAGRIADLGSGAGFPGLVLAASLPAAQVDLIESVARKCAYLRRAIANAGFPNAAVVCERAESWGAGEGRGAYDAVTARAVGRLSTVAELASPLLRRGGFLLAWKGRRDPEEESEAARAEARTAIEPLEVRSVRPYPASRDRHIHLLRKNGPTPDDLPRRVGSAAKRPFGAE